MLDIKSKTNLLKIPTQRLEIELLLACSRTNVPFELKARIQELVQQEIDWKYLIELASLHQLISLVYYNLTAICKDAVPPEYLATMRQVYVHNTQKNMAIAGELVKINRLFQANQIFAIPFKGITLAMSAYKNLAFRDSCDIDILIGKRDFPLATKLLLNAGYEMTGYIATVKDNLEIRYGSFLQSENNQKGYDFIHRQKRIAIDLQWSLVEQAKSHYFNLDFEQLKAETGEVFLVGCKLPQFGSETMVLYLCFHGSKHCWQSLKWICDLAEFINAHPELDWQKIEEKARVLKLTTMLHLGMLLAHNFYQTTIPTFLLSAANKNIRARSLFKQVGEMVFIRRFTQWEDYRFVFQITDSKRGKIKFLRKLLFTPTTKDWDTIRLPKSLFPLYYLIRPYRLTKVFFGK